jgi:SAM-dependent methyltransferase
MYWRSFFIQTGKQILIRFPKKVARFFEYWGQFLKFKRQNSNRSAVKLADTYPCLNDKLSYTPFDQHYTYHPAWAARVLAQTRPAEHTDISSILHFGTVVSAFIPIRFYDYRPAELNLRNYQSGFADLKQLPFENSSIASLSCMHTIEHIGLGRYGDELDSDGDIKAIEELKRVLQPGGDLLFVTPVGKPKVQFNAHRVYSYEQIVNYFSPLTLKEFSLVPDKGGLIENADPALVAAQEYGCGCFWFKK